MKNQFSKIQKEIEKKGAERDERAIPIAQFMIESFVNNKCDLKLEEFSDVIKNFQPIYDDVVKKGLEDNWKVNDIIYGLKFIIRMYEGIKNVIQLGLEQNQEIGINKFVGKNIKELTLKEVDEMLKGSYKNTEK